MPSKENKPASAPLKETSGPGQRRADIPVLRRDNDVRYHLGSVGITASFTQRLCFCRSNNNVSLSPLQPLQIVLRVVTRPRYYFELPFIKTVGRWNRKDGYYRADWWTRSAANEARQWLLQWLVSFHIREIESAVHIKQPESIAHNFRSLLKLYLFCRVLTNGIWRRELGWK
jgi:hypothetical protein